MLSKVVAKAHPCLVTDLKGKAFSLSPVRVMLAVGVSIDAVFRVEKFPSISGLLNVLSCWKGSGFFSNVSSAPWE